MATAPRQSVPSPFRSTADPALRPCGCTWVSLARAAWSWRTTATCRSRPIELIDNEYSLLDQTDLVFIDPMNTGYSRPVEGVKPKEWHGFKKDIQSVGDFIRLYTTRTNRWLSPKFLIGESYGTTRAAGLSGYLQERHGMYLNGIMLISAVLDFTTVDFNLNNDLPYILFLPGYTATAWYHNVLQPHRPLQTWLEGSRGIRPGRLCPGAAQGRWPEQGRA